jgi:hypothetical protein
MGKDLSMIVDGQETYTGTCDSDLIEEVKCKCGHTFKILKVCPTVCLKCGRRIVCLKCGRWIIPKPDKTNVKTIVLSIKCCNKCPYFDMKKRYTPDSFENVFDWICLKNKDAIIASVDTFDKNPKIPEWCPL